MRDVGVPTENTTANIYNTFCIKKRSGGPGDGPGSRGGIESRANVVAIAAVDAGRRQEPRADPKGAAEEPQETTEIKENDNDKEQSDDESMECSELTAFNNPAALLDIASWKKHIQAGASLASLKSALDEYFMVPLQIARVSDHARYQQRVLLRFMVEACVMPFEEAALPIMDLILRGRMYAEGKSPDELKKFDEIVSASCTPPRYAGALKAVNETDTRGWRPRTQGFGRGRGQQQGRQQQGRLPLEVWSKLSPEDRERVKSSRK